MMIFYIGSIFLCVSVCFLLARPLFQDGNPTLEEGKDPSSLRQMLSRIERDRVADFIEDQEAEEAILEAKHVALNPTVQSPPVRVVRPLRFAGVIFLTLTPVIVAVIYTFNGEPAALTTTPSFEQAIAPTSPRDAIAAMAPPERQAAIEAMVAGLAARLRETPEDVEGWRMLARSYAVLNQHEESIDAYRSLLRYSSGTRDDLRNMTAALIAVHGEGGDEAGDLSEILKTTLERYPDDPLALYQLGAVERAAGAPAEAVRLWRRLLSQLPPEAPVLSALQAEIAEAEAEISELNP